ncbi:MAG: efflux RND transporter periplasmic adaptor subunit [Mucinivorans sp.]
MKIRVKSILFLGIATMGLSCGESQQKSQSGPLIVSVAKATLQESASGKEFSFMAKPYRASELSFRVGGPIDQFDVYAGQFFKKGDVIAQIDPRDFKIRCQRAEALYLQAKAEAERIEILFKSNNISASTYEKSKADHIASKMAFQTAVNELEDTKLIAPFSGYVGQVYIEKYQDVKATEVVISLVDISQLKIEAFVTQDIAFNAAQIPQVKLYFDAQADKIYTAKVEQVSKSTTANNLSYLLTAMLANGDGRLLSGMSGKIFFELDSPSSSMVVVPQKALSHRPTKGDYLWVVDSMSHKVSARQVTLGPLQKGGMVAIVDGINQGEIVATSGLRFLSNLMEVEVENENN